MLNPINIVLFLLSLRCGSLEDWPKGGRKCVVLGAAGAGGQEVGSWCPETPEAWLGPGAELVPSSAGASPLTGPLALRTPS